jgi:hypothetical protein
LDMSIGPIAGIAGSYLQSIISPALRSAGLTSTASNSASSASQPDNGQLSPFAQLLNTLQQLQQSKPSQYGQVTQQIATNLQSAAQTAQSNGNTTATSELNTLASDFTSASQSGQLPNVQDLAKALGGGHHHHHPESPSRDSDGGSSSSVGANPSGSAASSASQMMSQLLASFQTNAAQSASTDPASIILNTLSNAGLGGINA